MILKCYQLFFYIMLLFSNGEGHRCPSFESSLL